jgi:ribokinase
LSCGREAAAGAALCETAVVSSRELRVAVVGHVEWVQFGRVEHLPRAGEVAHARSPFEEPAGGGAVAAVALARLAGGCTLHTVLGEDEPARRSVSRLGQLGVEVRSGAATGAPVSGSPPTRRAVTLVDAAGERTITTFGPRLDPAGEEATDAWADLQGLDAVYFTAGDLAALRRARAGSRVLVANPRARHALGQGVPIDALVLSAEDRIELAAAEPALGEAELIVYTEGARGGRWQRRDGQHGRWAPAPLPGPVVDSYGAGDTFAAALTYALGAGLPLERGLALAAARSAEVMTWAGPYGHGRGTPERELPET